MDSLAQQSSNEAIRLINKYIAVFTAAEVSEKTLLLIALFSIISVVLFGLVCIYKKMFAASDAYKKHPHVIIYAEKNEVKINSEGFGVLQDRQKSLCKMCIARARLIEGFRMFSSLLSDNQKKQAI
ncbi:hypothetical protein NEMIN01_1163 [Nematocida minor]|uniref:uncharacterized protein n=1 Tax=Nematocida minor TaxID=1912983 RepID=UPI00221ED91E|nr:uncharacterized protein NEMIN01_1163 [Nematocida minor]KAI5190698.1 hypothetical protein NEMIN01_1163 [Nematocida minor]